MPEGFDPEQGTVARAVATCPACGSTVDADTTRKLFQEGKSGQRMVAVVTHKPNVSGKRYRIATDDDIRVFREAEEYLKEKREELMLEWGVDPVPDEEMPLMSGVFNVPIYGMNTWGDLFNSRQKLALVTFADKVQKVYKLLIGTDEVEGQAGCLPYQACANNPPGDGGIVWQASCLSSSPACGNSVEQPSFLSLNFQPLKNFRIYRRNFPHWEQPNSVYFITFRTAKDSIIPEAARDIVFNSIKYHSDKKYKLYACAVMPSHTHIIIQPLEKAKDAYYSLAEIMHSIKSYSANQIKKHELLLTNTPVFGIIGLRSIYNSV